jgi:hypothetical protein
MPLLRIDAIKGRGRAEIESLLDATHRAAHLLSVCRSEIAISRHIRSFDQGDVMSKSIEVKQDLERRGYA